MRFALSGVFGTGSSKPAIGAGAQPKSDDSPLAYFRCELDLLLHRIDRTLDVGECLGSQIVSSEHTLVLAIARDACHGPRSVQDGRIVVLVVKAEKTSLHDEPRKLLEIVGAYIPLRNLCIGGEAGLSRYGVGRGSVAAQGQYRTRRAAWAISLEGDFGDAHRFRLVLNAR